MSQDRMFKKPYTEEEIIKIKETLQHEADGRYEKKREDKKGQQPNSTAKYTMSDIFPDKKEDIYPILKEGDQYYALFEELSSGDFGTVKYAMNIETGSLFIWKKMEVLRQPQLAEYSFDPMQLNQESKREDTNDLEQLKLTVYKMIYDLNQNIKNKKIDSNDLIIKIYEIYQMMVPLVPVKDGKIKTIKADGLERFQDNIPDYLYQNEKATCYNQKDFIENAGKLDLTTENITSLIYQSTLEIPENILNSFRNNQSTLPPIQSSQTQFMQFTQHMRERAKMEFDALNKMQRGIGGLQERKVMRNILMNLNGRKIKTDKKTEDTQFHFLMKLIPSNSLLQDIKNQTNTHNYFKDTNDALDIVNDWIKLRDYGFYHGDLKPDNIKRDESGHYVLIDFGSVSTFNPKTKEALFETYGSLTYSEASRRLPGKTSEANEVYCMGAVLAELYGFGSVTMNQFRFEKPTNLSKTELGIYELVCKMRDENPVNRPSMDAAQKALLDFSKSNELNIQKEIEFDENETLTTAIPKRTVVANKIEEKPDILSIAKMFRLEILSTIKHFGNHNKNKIEELGVKYAYQFGFLYLNENKNLDLNVPDQDKQKALFNLYNAIISPMIQTDPDKRPDLKSTLERVNQFIDNPDKKIVSGYEQVIEVMRREFDKLKDDKIFNKLSKNDQKFINEIITKFVQNTGIYDIAAQLQQKFNTQYQLLDSKKSNFLGKKKPVSELINKSEKETLLIRSIGLMLKDISQVSEFKSLFADELNKKLDMIKPDSVIKPKKQNTVELSDLEPEPEKERKSLH